MPRSRPSKWLGLILSLGVIAGGASTAWGDSGDEKYDLPIRMKPGFATAIPNATSNLGCTNSPISAPPVDPGFDAGWRRVFFQVNQVQAPGSTFPSVPAAAHSIAVRMTSAPPTDPGFDPGLRRILFKINQVQPVGFVFSVPVAAHSVAVRRN